MDNSKNLMNNDKILCLYCDKAFSNINDQKNHVERDHKAVLNKAKRSLNLRKSERITKNSSSENSHFAACFFCNNRKIIKSDDLESLFKHLLSVHKDVYFVCKCRTRLLDKISLANHRKICKIGGGKNFKSLITSESVFEKGMTLKRKSIKKSQSKSNVDAKCDNINSECESFSAASIAAAAEATTTTTKNHSVKTLPTNAINKKSDRSNSKNSNSSKNANHLNDKRKIKIMSVSSNSSSSSKASDEYTIPLTRQKLKDPAPHKICHQQQQQQQQQLQQQNNQQNSPSNNKKLQKNCKSPTSTLTSTTAAALSTSGSEKSLSSSNASMTKVQRIKSSKVINQNTQSNCEAIETAQKNEMINSEFDDDFYKNISQNIRVNLNYHIDGKVDRLQLSKPAFDIVSADESNTASMLNFVGNINTNSFINELKSSHSYNEDLSNTISSNNDESQIHEKEIHESTNFELSTPFPALLTVEQYGFGDSNPNKNKRHITKNSWKWKWDLIKKYKYVNEGGKIVKKVKQITTGLKDLSQLDIWTQLSMRSRYENLNNQNSTAEFDDGLNDSLSTRMIKTQNLEQLNSILDKRLQPEINIEQLQQTIVKEEPIEGKLIFNSSIDVNENKANDSVNAIDSGMLNMLNLTKTNVSKIPNPALSGEWARPRCFVCVDCGQEFDLMKNLSDHKNSEHPYVVSAHYEVVGRENLEQKLYRNLFLPKKALQSNANAASKNISINSDSKSNDATSTSESSSNYLMDQKEKECTKCMKMIKYSADIDIYRHILDCIEDRVWMQAKKRSKYRRSRRKSKKNIRKSRLSTDQKKNTSSPFQKENIEGENSLLSISNPPTPKEEKKAQASSSCNAIKAGRNESFISDNAPINNDGMNIKSFFRVSKTTPNLPQKIVVQMLEMPTNSIPVSSSSTTSSLRHSLRSSTKKHSNNNNQLKNQNPRVKEANDQDIINNKSVNANTMVESVEKFKEENINKEERIEILNTKKESTLIDYSSLQLPEQENTNTFEKVIKPTSPTNSSPSANNNVLNSPTSNSTVPKKKKKLNDCIAMLTCKIQEKLGVNFFDSTCSEIFPTDNVLKHEEDQHLSIKTSLLSPNDTPISPCTSPKTITDPFPMKNSEIDSNETENNLTGSLPVQENHYSQTEFKQSEQNEVIDLSVKKKSEMKQEKIKFPSLNDDVTPKEAVQKEKRKEISNDCNDDILIVPEAQKKTESNEENCLNIKQNSIQEKESASNEKKKSNEYEVEIEGNSKIESTTVNEKKEESRNDAKFEDLKNLSDFSKIKESFKISISKDRIPNLDEILRENHVITVNNLKISDAERKAFEEQKNRIRQILSKTKKTPSKKQNKKTLTPAVKKSPQKKSSMKQIKEAENKISNDPVEDEKMIYENDKFSIEKTENEDLTNKQQVISAKIEKIKETINEEEPIVKMVKNIQHDILISESTPNQENVGKCEPCLTVEKAENKIEVAANLIKTTNRIRCRRLSVVVDPIIHLSSFQSTNRKIRLTNNSQQNGFYDLLTNDQLFQAIKPQLKDEMQKSVKSSGKNSIKEAIEEVFGSNAKSKIETNKTLTKITKAKTKTKKTAKRRKSKFSRKTKKRKPIITADNVTDTFACNITESNQNDYKAKECKEVSLKQVSEKPNTKSDVEKTKSLITIEKIKNDSIPEKSNVKQTASTQKTNTQKKDPKEKILKERFITDQSEFDEIAKNKNLEVQKKIPKGRQKQKIKLEVDKDSLRKNQSLLKQTSSTEISAKNIKKSNQRRKTIEDLQVKERKTSEKIVESLKDQSKQQSKSEEKKIVPQKRDNTTSKVNSGIKSKTVLKKLDKYESKSNENTEKCKNKSEESVLDVSLSSDASNENDIPLAKLVCNKQVEFITEAEESLAKDFSIKSNNNKNKKKLKTKKPSKKKKVKKNVSKNITLNDEKVVQNEKESKDLNLKDGKVNEEIELKCEIEENVIQKGKKSLKENSQKLISEKIEIFSMEEDSFFNDNDIDQGDDKINDLVNNIINSSELVDSESEKNESVKSELDMKKEEAKCLVCKRSFKNEKVLEKHNKTSTHLFKESRKERRIAGLKEKEALKSKEEKLSEEKEKNDISVIKSANENASSITISSDEIKIFRTKGALKTFDNILPSTNNQINEVKTFETLESSANILSKEFDPGISGCTIFEPKESKPLASINKNQASATLNVDDDENDDLSRKDKIFDSLFSNIENKLQAAAANALIPTTKKFAFPSLTSQESEIESSSTSWDLQHDADIEWDGAGENNGNDIQPSLPCSVKEIKFAKKSNKSKETAINIPTKSLIMGKIFKKNRDREKQKTPQADAPNNKPGIKNSLDEIFDHLKNSAEIDDKVLTCPSPKTLLKSSGSTFSPQHSNDMLETASQSNNCNSSNNNAILNKTLYESTDSTYNKSSNTSSLLCTQQEQHQKKQKKNDEKNCKSTFNNNLATSFDEEEDGIGVRKSQRRCAIKTKTFAETWSSDEYEELHDTNDIISIINEIEKRESNANKRRKSTKSESISVENNSNTNKCEDPLNNPEKSLQNNNLSKHQNQQKSISLLKSDETINIDDKHLTAFSQFEGEKKRFVQLEFPLVESYKERSSINNLLNKKRKVSDIKDCHKSDDESFMTTKDLKPLKPSLSMMRKRRMSCFVPSTPFNDLSSPAPITTPLLKSKKHNNSSNCNNNSNNNNINNINANVDGQKIFKKTDRIECSDSNLKTSLMSDEKFGKSNKSGNGGVYQKKNTVIMCNNINSSNHNFTSQAVKRKTQKHRKRPRNKVKNIAYDSDSDFELNISKKSKNISSSITASLAALSDSVTDDDDKDEEDEHEILLMPTSQNTFKKSTINTNSNCSANSNITELTIAKEPKLLPNDLKAVQSSTATAKAAIPEDIIDSLQSVGNRTKRHSSEKLYYWSSSSSESELEHGDTADGENNEESITPQQPEQHGWIVGDSHKKLVTLLAHAKIKNKIN